MRILYCTIIGIFLLVSTIILPVSADVIFPVEDYCFQFTNISHYPDYIFLLYPSTNETGYTIINEGNCYRLKRGDLSPSVYAIKKIDFEKNHINDNQTPLSFYFKYGLIIPSAYSFDTFYIDIPPDMLKLQEIREDYMIESINNSHLFVKVTGCTYYYKDGTAKYFLYDSTTSRPNRYHQVCHGPGCLGNPITSTLTIPTTITLPIPLNTTVEIPTTQSAWLVPSIIAGIVIAGILLVRRKKGL